MECGGYLDFLPWRKRRLEDQCEYAHETIQLREGEELNGVVSEGGLDTLSKYAVRVRKCYDAEGPGGVGGGLLLLHKLMTSDELQLEDPNAVHLLKFIYQGNIPGLATFLEGYSREELDRIEIDGLNLINILCLNRDEEALRLVLAHDINPNKVNSIGITPLHFAVIEQWTEGVEVLLSYGAFPNLLPHTKRSLNFQELPVLTAARNGDFSTASLLLDQDPNLRLTDHERNTVLHLACQSHCVDLLHSLLEDKLVKNDISASNNRGNSPLHCLFIGNELQLVEEAILECVNMLLQKGAHINQVNAANKTPLYMAAKSNLPLVVKALLKSGADPFIKTKGGKTVLHAASEAGSSESLSLLLGSGRTSEMIFLEDCSGYSPFHYAAGSSCVSCCEILIKHGDHLTNLDSRGRSRCDFVLKNMPSALQLLRKLFDNSIKLSRTDPEDPNFEVEMDFSVLLSKTSQDVEASLISEFNSSRIDSLLKHPLVESFLYRKWLRIRGFFYLYVFMYFLFLIVHTFYIVKTYGMTTEWKNEPMVLMLVHLTHVFMVVALMIPSIITIFASLKKYFKQWETYFKVIALSTAAFVVFSRDSTFRNKDVEKNVASVSIFFTWVEFMMLLGRFPSLGVYILMFTRVAKSIIKFLFAFSPLLIAFTLTFGILFSNIEVFKSFPVGFVKTLMMMVGEIDYSALYENTKDENIITKVISQIFLVVFLFLIPILMANLLIGLAVNDLPDLQYHGKIRRLVKEASYIESYERLLLVFREWTCLPNSLINMFSERGHIKSKIAVKPNKIHSYRVSSPIPTETIKEAIEIGMKDRTGKANDLESQFKNFYEEYCSDRERLERSLEILTRALDAQGKAGGTDIPDGKQKKHIRSFSSLKKCLRDRKL